MPTSPTKSQTQTCKNSGSPYQLTHTPRTIQISGAFLEGAFIQVEKHYVRFLNPPILVVFRGGFIAMYTSLAGVTQHGAELQVTPSTLNREA
jgi:hypothetical protein